MSSLDKLAHRFVVVLNIPFGESTERFTTDESLRCMVSLLSFRYSFVALILHDCDVDENGNEKTQHIHFVLEHPTRSRISTELNQLSFLLGVPKNCISIDECFEFNMSIRYLLHLDNQEKAIYYPNEIYTNNCSRVTNALECIYDVVTVEKVLSLLDSYSLPEVMSLLGLSNYNKYHYVINDYIRFKKGFIK